LDRRRPPDSAATVKADRTKEEEEEEDHLRRRRSSREAEANSTPKALFLPPLSFPLISRIKKYCVNITRVCREEEKEKEE